MAHSEHGKSTRLNCDRTKKRSGIAAPISLKDLMEKEVQSSLQDVAICDLSVLADPSNEEATPPHAVRVKNSMMKVRKTPLPTT